MAAVVIVAFGRLRQKNCGFQVIQSHIEIHAVSKGREHKERKGMEKGERGDEEGKRLHIFTPYIEVSLDHFREGFIII